MPLDVRAESLALDEALRRAEAQHPEVRVALARIEQARGRKATARALLPNPEIEVSFETDAPFNDEGEGAAEVVLQQPLEIFGQRGLRIDAAEAELAALALDAEAARQRARVDTKVAFYRLMYEERRSQIVATWVEQADRLAEAGARRLAAGDISAAEQTLILADRADVRAEARTAAAELRAAQARLNVLVGNAGHADVSTSGDFPPLGAPRSLAELVARAAARPDLRAAEGEVVSRDREVALARRERIPVPILAVGLMRERSILGDLEDTDYLLGARLSIPIPLFQSGGGAVTEARGRRIEAEARRDGVARSIEGEVAAALAAYESARRSLEEYAEIEPRLVETGELYRKAYDAGQLDLAEYLAIRDRIVRARADALASRRDAAVAAVELEGAVGGSFTEELR